MALVLLPSVGLAQESPDCAPSPVLTPATVTPSDLRCFPVAPTAHRAQTTRDHAPLFPLVLGSVGAGAIGIAIGFGVGGASVGLSPQASESVRVDFAVANVALSVGLTSLVTAIVLALVHH